MNRKEEAFVRAVWEYYRRHGRRSLPWRRTKNPYRILVSEIMLQQTQVERVLPKYTAFVKQFPTVHSLARASLGEVLRMWQGLGYNRRAHMLHRAAREIESQYGGIVPKDYSLLVALSGIGPYTASAVCAFAYNEPVVLIETNVRSVYLHHFFLDESDVSDKRILAIIARTLDITNSREWYYALMDYGTYIKREFGNPNSRSKHYVQQSSFQGSDRQIRGAIVRMLSERAHTRKKLHTLPYEDIRIDAQIMSLLRDGLIEKFGMQYRLPL